MTIDEFEPEDALLEISRKLSNVSIHKIPNNGDSIDKDNLPIAKYLLSSTDRDQIKQSVRLLRRYLTQGKSDETSVDDILALDILPRIKELMKTDTGNSIKFECTWIITNIAAGTTSQTDAIIEAGFTDLLLDFLTLRNSKLELKAQAAWALGNVAGESAQYREELMRKNFPRAIVNVLNDTFDDVYDCAMDSKSGIRHYDEDCFSDIEALLWALSNMSRGGFRVAEHYESYLPMFKVFARYIIFDYTNIETEVCWGLSRILFNMHDIERFHQLNKISDELCLRLTQLLNENIPRVIVPVIRTIVNITSGPNYIIDGLLRSPLLHNIARLLDPQTPNEIRKDAFLVISNLAAGNEEMIQHVMDNASVMKSVIAHVTVPGHLYSQSRQWEPTLSNAYYYRNEEWKVTKEALWTVFNIISLGRDATVRQLLDHYPDLPRLLGQMLNYRELPVDICEKVVESMTSLIQRSNKWIDRCFVGGRNPYVHMFLSEGASTALPRVRETRSDPRLLDTCLKLETLLIASEEDVHQTATITEGIESKFGLPTIGEIKSKSSKRRILRNFDDGDVRLIENAVGNLCI